MAANENAAKRRALLGDTRVARCQFCGAPIPHDPRLIPVMVRGGGGHAPSKYRIYGEYATFAEAADVVQRLRRDPAVAWAYIPDEYASKATGE